MNSMAEMSQGYMPTPATILKLQVPCFIYPFTAALNEKHGKETYSKFKNHCHVKY